MEVMIIETLNEVVLSFANNIPASEAMFKGRMIGICDDLYIPCAPDGMKLVKEDSSVPLFLEDIGNIQGYRSALWFAQVKTKTKITDLQFKNRLESRILRHCIASFVMRRVKNTFLRTFCCRCYTKKLSRVVLSPLSFLSEKPAVCILFLMGFNVEN